MGSCEVPLIPNCAAMFCVYAKYGAFRLRLRLREKFALLLRRGLKLWLQPVEKLSPEVSPVSRKPNNWCELEFWFCFWKLKFNRSLLFNTKYDLEVRLEPQQQRLGARGKIVLRNDSTEPQKVVALQISSSLNWRAIRVDGKGVQFVSQSYRSEERRVG